MGRNVIRSEKSESRREDKNTAAMAGIGPDQLPVMYSEEEIARKQAAGPLVHVIRDEWHGQVETGTDPFDAAAEPYKQANPDKHFRFLSNEQSKKRTTRGFQKVRAKDGGDVRAGNQTLHWIPKEEKEHRERKLAETSNAALKSVEENYTKAEAEAQRDGGVEILKSQSARYRPSRVRVG